MNSLDDGQSWEDEDADMPGVTRRGGQLLTAEGSAAIQLGYREQAGWEGEHPSSSSRNGEWGEAGRAAAAPRDSGRVYQSRSTEILGTAKRQRAGHGR